MQVFLCTSVNFIRSMSSLTVRPLQEGLHWVALCRLPTCTSFQFSSRKRYDNGAGMSSAPRSSENLEMKWGSSKINPFLLKTVSYFDALHSAIAEIFHTLYE